MSNTDKDALWAISMLAVGFMALIALGIAQHMRGVSEAKDVIATYGNCKSVCLTKGAASWSWSFATGCACGGPTQ